MRGRGGPLPTLRRGQITLRAAVVSDAPRIAAILSEPEVSHWWPGQDVGSVHAEIVNEPSWTIITGHEPIGWLQAHEEPDPNYRHAAFDIALGAAHQGRGIGREALRMAIEYFTSEGHHRFTVDPAVGNERAIRCYSAVGFQPVGVFRAYERAPDGTWRDGLQMDLLAGDIPH